MTIFKPAPSGAGFVYAIIDESMGDEYISDVCEHALVFEKALAEEIKNLYCEDCGHTHEFLHNGQSVYVETEFDYQLDD